jgi:glutamyl-tRNA reductase
MPAPVFGAGFLFPPFVVLRTYTDPSSGASRIPIPDRRRYRYHVPSQFAFHVIGVSHHRAGVELREQFALTPPEVTAWLDSSKRDGLSAVLLSTCNRFELYWCGDDAGDATFLQFARARGAVDGTPIDRWDGLPAARHLFTVAGGMDSQVLGETEILGQVRRAFDQARAAGTTTREMDLVFSAALNAGRRLRRETLLGRHPSSVSAAAVDLMASCLGGDLSNRHVVVLGAGEAAEGMLRALQARRTAAVTLVNRRVSRGATLAHAFGATSRSWEDLPSLIVEADLLAVATSSSRPVVLRAELEQAVARRDGRELLVLDLAVPRNVEPAAREIQRLRLFDLDDLQRLCCPAAEAPAEALADAERIVDEELARLEQTLRGHQAAPRLAELHRLGAEVAEQEAAWALDQLVELTEQERDVVREMADRVVRRVLYPVSRSMRQPES